MKLKTPPKEPKTMIGIRLPESLADAFEKDCIRAAITLSEGIRQLIQDHLNKRGAK